MASATALRVGLQLRDWVRGRSYSRNLRLLERSQWWSRDELRAAQWAALSRMLDIAFTSVPYYRRRYAAAGAERGDIGSFDDYARLPPLTREQLRDHLEELRVPGELPRGSHLHATGGSSGIPVRFYRTLESYDWRRACTVRAYAWCGQHPGTRTLHLWGAPVGTPPRWLRFKEGLDHWLRGDCMVRTFLQTEEVWARAYAEYLRFRPRVLLGYVSSLTQFARYVATHHLALPHRLTSLVAAAEPLDENTRAYLQQALGAPVFNTYGSREFMSLAAECDQHCGLHIHAENVLLEAPSDPHEPGPILVTDLHNRGTFFLRYEIGDLGVIDDRACPCGRGLPLLDSVAGRALDLLRLADGRSISCIFFRHILKDAPEVLQYQVQQDAPDHITLRVVLGAPLSEASAALIQREFSQVLGATRFDLVPVDTIALSRSGKHKIIEAYTG